MAFTEPTSDEYRKQLDESALDVLMLARKTLMMRMRFMCEALSGLHFFSIYKSSLLTDGRTLFYNGSHVIDQFEHDHLKPMNKPCRDYLHVVLHCVFRHMFNDPSINREVWDLATDIAVENMINDLGIDEVKTARDEMQREPLEELKTEIGELTAEKLYRFFIKNNISKQKLAELRGMFYADNHEIWYMTIAEIEVKFGYVSPAGDPSKENDGQDGDGKKGAGQNKDQVDSSSGGGDGDDEQKKRFDQQQTDAQNEKTAQRWRAISDRMNVDLETFSKQHGTQAGSMIMNLKEVNREKYDYTSFLKKFAVMGEAMKLNDEEFDYVYSTFGLQEYRKIPLIEPLEDKDVKRIRDFVIAIDTSGSTMYRLVQIFLQKTFNILKNIESFFVKFNLHIIQCDADIQEHVKITTQDEFDSYLETFKIRGCGGTDFRPVFELVDQLIEQKEFVNLKGMIYFTDLYGTFPTKKPPYQTAFVVINEGHDPPDVPPWAIRMVLEPEDLTD